MGIQIRIKLNEKCTVFASPRRYSLSVSSASILNVMCDLVGACEDHLA